MINRFVLLPLAALTSIVTPSLADVLHTGAFTQDVPITVNPYHGIEPSLSLRYSSQASNGPMGVGWALSGIAEVRRTSSTHGSPNYDASDLFALDGLELIPCAGAVAGSSLAKSPSCKYSVPLLTAYATRVEQFHRIAFDSRPPGGVWYSWEPSGVKRTFAPSATANSWRLSRVEDPLGNAVDYVYRPTAAPGPDYIETISYNQTTIRFYWEPRPDPYSWGNGKSMVVCRFRLKSVAVEVEGAIARAYGISYSLHPTSGRSTVASIVTYGSNATVSTGGAVTGDSHPPLYLEYDEGADRSSWSASGEAAGAAPAIPNLRGSGIYTYNTVAGRVGHHRTLLSGDFDGDGRADALHLGVADNGNRPATLTLDVRLASQSWAKTVVNFPAPGHWDFVEPPSDGRDSLLRAWVADVNADGLDDLILVAWQAVNQQVPEGSLELLLGVALSEGGGSFSSSGVFQPTGWVTSGVWPGKINKAIFPEQTPHCAPGDFNGDRRSDFACVFQDGLSKQFLGVAYTRQSGGFQISTPMLVADDPGTLVPGSLVLPFETRAMAVADMNGDGMTDIMILDLRQADVAACAALGDPTMFRSTCAIGYDLLEFRSEGPVMVARPAIQTTWPRTDFLHAAPGSLHAADLDGDGRADFAYLPGSLAGQRNQTIREMRTALVMADGSIGFPTEQTLATALSSVRVEYGFGDVNGDGATDILVAMKLAPGAGVGCPAAAFNRAILTRVISNGDGTFTLPARWDDCGSSQVVNEQAFAWPQVELFDQMMTVGDTDGDGLTDFLLPIQISTTPNNTLLGVYDRTSAPALDMRRWISADVSGEGRDDLVYVLAHQTQTSVHRRVLQADGTYVAGSRSILQFGNVGGRTFKWLDANGDGRADLVHIECPVGPNGTGCSLQFDTMLATTGGDLQGAVTQRFSAWVGAAATIQWNAGDVDGDGKIDIVAVERARNVATGVVETFIKVYQSRGDGNWRDVPRFGPIPQAAGQDISDVLNWRVIDLDGDGRTDLLHLNTAGTGYRSSALLSRPGNAWKQVETTANFPPIPGGWPVVPGGGSGIRWHGLDVNGDGRMDLVRTLKTASAFIVHTLTSMGSGVWSQAIADVTAGAPADAATFFDRLDWYALDANEDGSGDLVRIDGSLAGVRMTVLQSRSDGEWSWFETPVGSPTEIATPSRPDWQFADLAGRGVRALVRVAGRPGGTLQVERIQLGERRDLLTRLSRSGATSTILYQASAFFAEPDPAHGCVLPLGLAFPVVSKVTISEGRSGNQTEMNHGYACGRYSQQMRMFLGWTDLVAGIPAVTNRPAVESRNRYTLTDQCFAQPSMAGLYAGNRYVGTRQITAYNSPGASAPFNCLPLYTQRVMHDNPQSDAIALNSATYFTYDEFGNLAGVLETGRPEVTGDERFHSRTFKSNTADYIVNCIGSEQLHAGEDSAGKVLRSAILCYDGDATFACTQPPTKGLMTQQLDIREQGTRKTDFFYDTLGSLVGVRDANGHGIQAFLDPVQHIFPISFTNALQRTSIDLEWDRRQGVITRRTDANGAATTVQYDVLGRAKRFEYPGGRVILRDFISWGNPADQHVLETVPDGSADGLWTRQYLDGLGRPYRIERKGASPGEKWTQQFEYSDDSDRLYRYSDWFQLGTSKPRYRTFTWDSGLRVSSQRLPDGSISSWSYDTDGTTLTTRYVDEARLARERKNDAYGRIVQAREFDGAATLVTSFAYDARDQIISVTDANGNLTTYEWDLLGRNTKLTDPNLGVRTMTYDLVGNLSSRTDARNQTVTFVYDDLNRLKTKVYPNNQTVTWNYDEAGHGQSKDRLTSILDRTSAGCPGGVSEDYNYDQIGRLSTFRKCIEGMSQTVGFGYDSIGRRASITYPDNEVVTQSYDAAGRLASVSGVIANIEYDPSGRTTAVTFANTIVGEFTYDTSREMILTESYGAAGSKRVYGAEYVYRANGSLSRSRPLGGGTFTQFTYDGAGRLTGTTGATRRNWTYDAAGNMTTNSSLGQYTYLPQGPAGCVSNTGAAQHCSQPHAVRTAGPYTFQYNANGLVSMQTNTVTRQVRSIDWDEDSHPLVLQDFDGTTVMYAHDSWGRRVIERRGQDTVRFFGGLGEHSSLRGATKHYFAGRLPAASENARTRVFYHLDRSGSTRAVTASDGHALAGFDYTPYGGTVLPAANIEQRYNGELVDNSGLIYLGARLYDPVVGRFLAPDTILPDALNTQAANRYAYAYNNPARFTDPSGHQAIGIGGSFQPGPGTAQLGGSSFVHSVLPPLPALNPLSGGGGLGAPATLNFSPMPGRAGGSAYSNGAGSSGGDDHVSLALTIGSELWDNKMEIVFGGVTGALEGVLPAGWLLPFDTVPERLNFSPDQAAYFNLSRGAALFTVGIGEVTAGVDTMVAGAIPTVVGGITVETGVGALVFAGGGAIEATGAVVALEGATDVVAGLAVLAKSGIYILRDRKGVIRYIGRTNDFDRRKMEHADGPKAKPKGHSFKKMFEVDDLDIQRGLEQILLEFCPTCFWNNISCMAGDNKKFMYRVIQALEWAAKTGNPLPILLK